LLRDLELRLALPSDVAPRSSRVARFVAQIGACSDTAAFYAGSFAADPLGTAETLLTWRDALVEASWDGRQIPDAGDRIAAMARLERAGDPTPRGDADRLARVQIALARQPSPVYEHIVLAEDSASWPGLWQQVFAALERRGTRFETHLPQLPGAPPASDLGRLQSSLRGDTADARAAVRGAIRGDGSLVVLRGDTSTELAELTAAMLAMMPEGTLVVRSGDGAQLEAALTAHGLAAQGLASSSRWRPAMQVLPLSVELAFEPRDPYRALELLTLSVGPFRGTLGRRLAKAVARSPGIGGSEWQKRKEDARVFLHAREVQRSIEAGASPAVAASIAAAYVAERMQRVEHWFEIRGVSPDRAPAALFLEIAARVHAWLISRLATAPEVYGPALVQAKAFLEVLAHDSRERVSREEVRHLLDTVVRAPHDQDSSIERAGRIAHVSHPSAVLGACRTIVHWGFVAGAERRPRMIPWNKAELAALRASGVRLQDPARLLAQETNAWRRSVLAACERVVFVIPGSTARGATAPHPLWDEICARLDLDGPAVARLTHDARETRAGRRSLVPLEVLDPRVLPDPAASWRLGIDVVGDDREHAGSATSLETLVSCPLRWVLEERAELRSGAVTKVAAESVLCGNLGHRLVEELFAESAFDLDERAYAARARALLDRLLRTEAATLLLPGMTFERAQLVPQLLRAARDLRRYLVHSGFRVTAVETEIEVTSAIGTLRGRIDVRLADDQGRDAVLDLKWGETRYREVVREGRAIQLAAYARAISTSGADSLPPAAYFALRSGRVVTGDPRMNADRTIDAEALEVTWMRVDRTAQAVVASLRRGDVPVAGIRRSLPLLDELGIAEPAREGHYAAKPDAACRYCSYGSLCGRAWEGFR
jgi:RecB family exonuclease